MLQIWLRCKRRILRCSRSARVGTCIAGDGWESQGADIDIDDIGAKRSLKCTHWPIPAIFTLYYIFILQISYTVNMIIWYIHIHIHIYIIYIYTFTHLVTWCLKWFEVFYNETFQHQMICLAFESTAEKPHRKVSQIRLAETGGSTSRGRPTETGRDRERPLVCQHASSVQKNGGRVLCLSFSRSRMPTIWKSLLALQLQHQHANICLDICLDICIEKKECQGFWNMQTIWKKRKICKICECKRCKRCMN